ncbi:hypothetical protein LCGC14_0973580 [marine sediment metagenome]|uniref:Uncharacterized protein n=1 Tax=marine sediment metagenome TaxID=412755 RepID=A0A0F9QU50_9ZZZZ|nr:hypothetical protein [Methylophaga sp.]HEC58887.1 hypothetical protein [Methylophaga sp.]
MKTALRKRLSLILNHFESGNDFYVYKPSHRKILLVMGGLFLMLSIVSLITTVIAAQWAGVLPISIFFIGGFICMTVGFLGSDHAVAKMWGSK